MLKTRKFMMMAVVAFLFWGCAGSMPEQSQSADLNPLTASDQQEIEIGNQIHNQVLSSFYLYTEPHLVNYVNRVARKLAERTERTNLPYSCTIIVSEKIFATSAPGGHVYITTGFINILQNEAELAGVLAHEIAELQYRSPRMSSSKKALEVLTVGGSLVGGFFGDIGVLAVLGLRAVDALTDEKSREDRVELADSKAMSYLYQTGYDPQAWIDVIYRVVNYKDKNVYLIFDYYTSRPISEIRIRRLESLFKKFDFRGISLDLRRDAYLDAIRGIREMYGPA